jgi:hypothetical protein
MGVFSHRPHASHEHIRMLISRKPGNLHPLRQTGLAGLLACALLLTFSGNIPAAGSIGRVEPIFARYARIYHAPTLDFKVEYFRDKPMEELGDFNGYTATLDFTYPINDVSQIELLLPLYTNGKGDYNKPGEPFDGRSLDVEGNGGVRDFASLIYERRIPWLEHKLGVNIAWMAGTGKRLDTLEARRNGELVDEFNHEGDNHQFGLKIDTDISDGEMTLFGNLRYVMFRDTDDINLTGDDVDFEVLYATGAIMFNTYGHLTPVLEVLLEHDFEDFTAVSLSPELIYTLSDGLDIKFGAPFSLTSDGQDYAAVLELTYRF